MIIRFLERSTKEDCVEEEGHSIASFSLIIFKLYIDHRKKGPENTRWYQFFKNLTRDDGVFVIRGCSNRFISLAFIRCCCCVVSNVQKWTECSS